MLRFRPQALRLNLAIDSARVVTARWSRFYVGAALEDFSWKPVVAGLSIGIALAVLVFAKGLFANDGYLSPDSITYLSIGAQTGPLIGVE